MFTLLVRRWQVALPIVLLTVALGFLVQRVAPSSYEAVGTVMLARPEIDPSRSALRGIDLAAIADLGQSDQVRSDAVQDGGTSRYTVQALDARRIQVSVSEPVTTAQAMTTVETVLRHLARAVEEDQQSSDRAEDQRVRPRLLIDVPSDPGPAASRSAAVTFTEVTGTLLLRDPLEGNPNPFQPWSMPSLLVSAITSDAQRERIAAATGSDITFEVGVPERRASWVLELRLAGPDRARTLAGFDTLVAALGSELESWQRTADVPVSERLLIEVLATPQQATSTSPPIKPLTVLTTLVGLALAATAATVLDRSSRSTRLEADPEARTDAHAPTDTASRQTTEQPA